ncbi:TRAF-type zinc finger domain-containing protein 1 isoform X2 [Grus americana]|uniref:TRAF-type zinc finger domain-containing protein 1 isoform X2 n=1 Tax=Grus americana TaxID=9117 RepID=UPI002408728A|nr:TRAF-type zinc finger domain-containing protein 1 isoform X2 [Grus americana]
MAIAAVPEAETRLCGNCKRDIPLANFIVHEIHCRRNIELCCFCSESVPKSEMKNHIESEHVQVTCKCQMKIEKSLLKDHEASACPLRPAVCQYCDIQLTFNKLQDHEIYCGARTETCGACGRNIMVQDLKEHPRVCGQEVKQVRGSRTVPRYEDADLRAMRDIGNWLRSEDELEQLERNENTHSSLYEEWNTNLDYVLALSLQNENNPHNNAAAEIPSDFWEDYYTKESAPSACLNETDKSDIFSCDSSVSFSTSNHIKNDEIIMLPCEFCEELYPAEDLILHQPQAVQAEGNIIIPCEFCGIQLEEEMLFHHQHRCDLRPAASFPRQQVPPPQATRERRESPELARRRVRHQGDVSPWRAGGFEQQRLSYPAGGTKSLSNLASVRNMPLCSLSRAGDAPDSKGKPRRTAGSEGRSKNKGASESAGGTTPRARPTQNFDSEAFMSSFSRTSPAQQSTGGGRSLGLSDGPASFRRRSTKAKAQSPASEEPEEK